MSYVVQHCGHKKLSENWQAEFDQDGMVHVFVSLWGTLLKPTNRLEASTYMLYGRALVKKQGRLVLLVVPWTAHVMQERSI